MLRVFKWLWEKAESHGEQKILDELHGLCEYHNLKSQLANMRAKYEPDTKEFGPYSKYPIRELSAKEHSAIAQELDKILRRNYEVKNGR